MIHNNYSERGPMEMTSVNVTYSDLPSLVTQNERTPELNQLELAWKRIYAFDIHWWVPYLYDTGLGSFMSVLCERLERDGYLKPSIYRQWMTGHPILKHYRPTLNPMEWRDKVPIAASAYAWTYYLPDDVERVLPPPTPCKVCGLPEDQWQEHQSLLDGEYYYFRDVCSDLCFDKAKRKERLECLKQRRELKRYKRGGETLKQIKAYLKRNANPPVSRSQREESRPDQTSPTL